MSHHPDPDPRFFVELQRTHRLFEEAFARHQEALLAGDLEAARERLDWMAARLRRHAELEEAWLQPIYVRDEAPRGGHPRLFPGEHRKIERFLDRMAAALRGAAGPRDVIALFDLEARFKGLLHHHFDREEAHYLPQCDRLSSPGERARAWEGFALEEDRLREGLGGWTAADPSADAPGPGPAG